MDKRAAELNRLSAVDPEAYSRKKGIEDLRTGKGTAYVIMRIEFDYDCEERSYLVDSYIHRPFKVYADKNRAYEVCEWLNTDTARLKLKEPRNIKWFVNDTKGPKIYRDFMARFDITVEGDWNEEDRTLIPDRELTHDELVEILRFCELKFYKIVETALEI